MYVCIKNSAYIISINMNLSALNSINALKRETYGKVNTTNQVSNNHLDYNQAFIGNSVDDTRSYDKFISHLHMMMKSDLLNSLQYTYFTEFAKIDGTLINIRFFIDLIDQIESEIDAEYKDDLDTQENESNKAKKIENKINILCLRNKKLSIVTKFKIICAELFDKFLKYDEKLSKIRINKNIRYKLTKVDTINFTSQQVRSLWTIYDFLIDPNSTTFCFQGYAGTGKTTTIVELVSYLIRNSYIQSVAFTAPTNKAVNVIKGKFRPHLRYLIKTMFNKDLSDNFCFDDEIVFLELKGIKISFITIHKLLMFKTDYSISGDMIFVRDSTSSSLIPEYELVLVDECSMINMDMIDNIFQEIRSAQNMRSKGFKRRAKIMFTGDPAQLPPVNESRSSIFSNSADDLSFDEYMNIMNFKTTEYIVSDAASLMRNKYDKLIADLTNMKSFLLTDVVRSRLDNVTNVCNEFRHLVADDDYDIDGLSIGLIELFGAMGDNDKTKNVRVDDKTKLEIHGVALYQYQDGMNKLQTPWFQKFLNAIKTGTTAIILTWTNRQTDIYNEAIRRRIFKNCGDIKKFEIGDILMLSEFYSLDLGEEFVAQKLFTSEQIKVVKTEMQEIPLRGFEMITTKSYLKMKNYHKINADLEMLIKYMNDELCKNKKVLTWLIKVHRLGEDPSKSMPIMVIDDRDLKEFKRWKSTSNDMIRNFSNKLMNRYKTSQKSIERSIIKPVWMQWRKIYDESFANVNYGYSITTHKAQGSGFQDAYVDLNDILQNPNSIESHKCAYTAVTRASYELHVLI
jgi:hypothetical protein